jgi:hypothetical protein
VKITDESRDKLSGYRTGRCGEWYVRVRPDGATFDLALHPFLGWEKTSAEFVGLSLDQTSRLLGVPRGELFDWGRA